MVRRLDHRPSYCSHHLGRVLKVPSGQRNNCCQRLSTYTTLEIYGNPIRPIDIPEWHVSVQRPIGNGIRSNWSNPGYSGFMREIHNSDVQYDPETDSMHFRVGGNTERVGSDQTIYFNE